MSEIEDVIVNSHNDNTADQARGGDEETEPLLWSQKLKNNTTKVSSRRLGQVPPEPIYITVNEDRQNDLIMQQEEGYGQDIVKINKSYNQFRHYSSWILNIFIFINILWFVFTLVTSYFFSFELKAKIHKRYSGYNELCIIFISIFANLLNLWFNRIGIYSSVDFDLNIILMSLTIFDIAVLYLINYTRKRMAFIGTFTYLWAAFTFGIGIMLDWKLYSFKMEISRAFDKNIIAPYNNNQSITTEPNTRTIDQSTEVPGVSSSDSYWRNTYSPFEIANYKLGERHTLHEWISIFIKITLKLILLLYMILFSFNTVLSVWDIHFVSKLSDASLLDSYPHSYDAFHWVDENHTYQLHIRCFGDVFQGNGKGDNEGLQPIILYEHGGYDTGFTSSKWIHELFATNEIDRYCTYERPGYGLSDSAPALQSISMIADAIGYSLFTEANITGPFICVGYDIGGLYSQVFAGKYLDKTEGLMLIDSWNEKLLIKDNLDHILPHDSSYKDRFNLPISLKSHSGFNLFWKGLISTLGLKLQASWLFHRHNSNDRILGNDMIFQGKFLRTKFLEKITSPLLSNQDVLDYRPNLQSMKLSVVTSKSMVKRSLNWGVWQRELTKISKRTKEWKMIEGDHLFYQDNDAVEETKDVLLRLVNN